jgi:hypothetical protein
MEIPGMINKKFIVFIIMILALQCFGAWDNTKPADSDVWNDAAGYIRDNWDALETVFGVDLADANTGYQTVHNVQSAAYGAEGDGATDDSTEIQAAIDAANAAGGGVVFFPEATYAITSALVPKSNVTLEGEEGAIIYFTGINAIDSNAAVANFTVRNLIFNGRSGQSKGIYITDATSTFIKVENCEFENMGASGVTGGAIEIIAANYVWIQNNNIHDCFSGVYVTNSNSVVITGNQVRDIGLGAGDGQNCIVVWATAGSAGDISVEFVTISNNICEDGTDNGIRITSQGLLSDGTTAGSVSYVTITGNIVNEMGHDCFRLGGNYITCTGNVAIDAGISAYRAAGGSYIEIADNIATVNSTRTSTISSAIYLVLTYQASSASNISVIGNIINSDEWRSGIWISGEARHSGTSTSTNTNQLIDSTATFETDEVYAGNWVHNTTDNTWAQVVTVVSETVLTLSADIFPDVGDAFRVNAMGQGLVVANNTLIDVGTSTSATGGALTGIDINYWFDASVTGNRCDNTYEGIDIYRCVDAVVQNNYVVNCIGGSGRGIETDGVTRAIVSDNYVYGNTKNYELDAADTTQSGMDKTIIVELTNAEVDALRASPKELVAAPGAGRVIEFVSAVLILDYGTNGLTETDDNLAIEYNSGSGAAVSETIEMTGFIDQTADTITRAIPVKDAIDAAADIVNKNLALVNTGDAEFQDAGASTSKLYVIITYRIHATGL